MWYNIDFIKWAILLLANSYRKPKFIAFLKSLITPISNLHYQFLKKRKLDIFILNHNGQVCYLRSALNDVFDPKERRIRIGDGKKYARKYIYTKAEQKPLYLGKTFIREKSDFADTGVDYIVYAPNSIVLSRELELIKWIEVFNEATTKYKVIGE